MVECGIDGRRRARSPQAIERFEHEAGWRRFSVAGP